MGKHSIAALILTYNDSELTEKLCSYLLQQNEVKYIVVVDNSDNSAIQVYNAGAIPQIASIITYIKAPVNNGYAAGNNIGINHILANTDAEYIWIINNDIIPQANAATSMVDALKVYNNKAICGSVLLYYEDKDIADETARLQCYGGGLYYSFISKSKLLFKNMPLPELQNKEKRSPDFIMGASMMVHKDIFTNVGLLSEEYFMYFEELDWQTMAQKQGYRLIVADGSLVFHMNSLSTRNNRHGFYYLLNRAAIMFTKKYYKLLLPGVLLFHIAEAIFLVPGRKSKWYTLKGLYNGLVYKQERN